MARDVDEDSGRPFIEVNHPVAGDAIRNPARVAGYGTAFEGKILLKTNLEFARRPNQRLGVVEAFEASASGSGEELHLDRVPIVFA